MIAILEKYEHNVDFHQIVDFVKASHIRRNLKLNDEEGISTLPDAKIFEILALMSPKSIGFNELSSNIANAMTRIKMFEDKDGEGAEPSREDATIKERSLETGEEAGVEKSTERGSNDTEELVNILTSMDAANILTSRVQAVSVPPVTEIPTVGISTGNAMVPTPSPIFTTASVVTPYSRRKEMEEEMVRDAQRMNEQIARYAEIARIHAEEELQMLIDGLDRNNDVIAKHLQEYEQFQAELTIGEKIDLINELVKYQEHHAKILKEKFIPVWKQTKDFVPMALKKEGERFKRKGLRLEQGSAKKIKTAKEVSEEDLKEMMQLVPVEEVYVEALQVKHLIIDWEIHTEGQRNYWKIIMLGGHTAGRIVRNTMLKSFPLPVKKFLLPEYFPTASEERFPLLSIRVAPAEEVCTGFEDPDHPDKVYKVVKELYGLHQAPRAWYETLANYFLENGFHKGKIDQTLFIKKQKGDIVKQKKDRIFISQYKYVAEILKKFGLTEGKSASTPIDIEKPLLKDLDGKDVDVHIYRLISWQCKKQTVIATSSTEAKYVAAASCCAQVLWIQNQLMDYGLYKITAASVKFLLLFQVDWSL
nr:hypothetical protein [Tanacetum cinerariifolium]